MATHTTNYNLEKPEASDPFGDFRQSYNSNMDIIDQNLGGGGGGGGHTIIDPNGSSMAQRAGLQFTGSCSVADDAVNDKTVVNISGGGGNVYGAFIDTDRIIQSATTISGVTTASYTATEDCVVCASVVADYDKASEVKIDNVRVWRNYNGSGGQIANALNVYLRKGQIIAITNGSTSYSGSYTVYGIKQGTSGIFAPVIYSDTERKIGIWRDNKPLYQKTVTFDGARSHGSNVFSTGILDAEEIVSISGMASYASGGVNNKWIPFTFSDDSTQNGITNAVLKINSFLRSTGEIYAYIGADYQSTYAINRVRITIQYTKTTDVAGSGDWNTDGVPTVHYDTSEKVIGTWINGKPIYQKTLTHSGALTVDNSFSNDIGSLVSVDQFISCEGYFRRTNANGLMYSLNGGVRPESGADSYKVTTRFYNGYVQVAVSGYSDIEYIALTVRYTKTTD